MTNDQMKANRILTWHESRSKVNAIVKHLESGKRVVIANYLHAWCLSKKHIPQLKACRNGAYLQLGKNWVCFDGCAIRFEK